MSEIIVPEQTLSGWEEISGLYALEAPGIFTKIMPCREYEIMFDGTKYVRTAKFITDGSDANVYVGNGFLLGLSEEDTGEPFLIAVAPEDGGFADLIATNQSGDSHTVSVTKTDTVLIEQEFDGFAFVSDYNADILQLLYSAADLTVGENYNLKIDGTEYQCEAKSMESDGITTVFLGNPSISSEDYENTGEPFLIAFIPQIDGELPFGLTSIMIQADSEKTSYTIGISPAEKAKTGVDIVLYDRTGEPVTYEGIETITTDTPTDGERATFTYGTLLGGVEIEPNFKDGNQKLSVPDGKLIKEATVKKPETLVPENILAGVEIAGIVGTHKDDTVLTGMEIPLDMAEGDQKLSVPDGYVVKTAVIKKPETLMPENIVKGTIIAGVVGEKNILQEITTENEMNEAFIEKNLGNAYMYLGESTEDYTYGDIYIVESVQ